MSAYSRVPLSSANNGANSGANNANNANNYDANSLVNALLCVRSLFFTNCHDNIPIITAIISRSIEYFYSRTR